MIFPGNIHILLFDACLSLIEEKISSARAHLDSVIDSLNDETKSSAGDKHETGRAMAQIEQEKAARQLAEVQKLKEELLKHTASPGRNIAGKGSIVITGSQNFYISVSLGAVKAGGRTFYVISPGSPIGALIMGKKCGDSVELNGNQFLIKELL